MPDETYGCRSRGNAQAGIVLAILSAFTIFCLTVCLIIVAFSSASLPSGDGGGASVSPSSYTVESPE